MKFLLVDFHKPVLSEACFSFLILDRVWISSIPLILKLLFLDTFHSSNYYVLKLSDLKTFSRLTSFQTTLLLQMIFLIKSMIRIKFWHTARNFAVWSVFPHLQEWLICRICWSWLNNTWKRCVEAARMKVLKPYRTRIKALWYWNY